MAIPVRRLSGNRRKPRIGQLDTPVTVYEGNADPDMSGDGFTISLVPMYMLWTSVEYSSGAYSSDGTPDKKDEAVHSVTARYEGRETPKHSYLILDDIVCRVVEVTPLDTRKEFIVLYATEVAAVADADVTFLDSPDQPVEEGIDSDTDPSVDDLWSDGY